MPTTHWLTDRFVRPAYARAPRNTPLCCCCCCCLFDTAQAARMHCSLSQHSVWVVDCDCALLRPVFLWEEGGNFKWLDGDGTRVRIFISISIFSSLSATYPWSAALYSLSSSSSSSILLSSWHFSWIVSLVYLPQKQLQQLRLCHSCCRRLLQSAPCPSQAYASCSMVQLQLAICISKCCCSPLANWGLMHYLLNYRYSNFTEISQSPASVGKCSPAMTIWLQEISIDKQNNWNFFCE